MNLNLSEMIAAAIHAGQVEMTSTVREVPRAQPTDCPGLVHEKDPHRHWLIPEGETLGTRSYCMKCTKKYGFTGSKCVSKEGCNCDAYQVVNKFDNGVFNVSFWSSDQKTLYPAVIENDKTTISMKSGTSFIIMIHGRLKPEQYFQYQVELGETLMANSEPGTYCYESTFVLGPNGQPLVFTYIVPEEPERQLLHEAGLQIVGPNDSIVIQLHIHKLQIRDLSLETGLALGRYKCVSGEVTPIQSQNKHITVYSDPAAYMLPTYRLTAFTKSPCIMEVVMRTAPDSIVDGPETKRLVGSSRDVLRKRYNVLLRRQAQAQTEAAKAESVLGEIEESLTELRKWGEGTRNAKGP